MTTLKFEVGKFYADRKGRKWECVCNDLLVGGNTRSINVGRSHDIVGHVGIGGGDSGFHGDTEIISEWAEPRKPREWDIWIDDAGRQIDDFMMMVLSGVKKIKVREVIDDKG